MLTSWERSYKLAIEVILSCLCLEINNSFCLIKKKKNPANLPEKLHFFVWPQDTHLALKKINLCQTADALFVVQQTLPSSA